MMTGFGVLAWFLEENGIPVAPAILGMVLGTLLEEHFVTSMIKAEGRALAFFERPIAGTLGVILIALLVLPTLLRLLGPRTKMGG
jgi:TctA family transporter